MADPIEPTIETKMEIGSLCMAWAYLENLSERALWGMLKLDDTHGPLVTWRLDMRARWQMLLEHVAEKCPNEASFLRKTNKLVATATRDRNIMVHGVVHSVAKTDDKNPAAFWTVFRGADAGKKFPVSATAAKTTRKNIQFLCRGMEAFNERNKYPANYYKGLISSPLEKNWPSKFE